MRKLHVDVAASLGGHDRLSTHDLSKFRYITEGMKQRPHVTYH